MSKPTSIGRRLGGSALDFDETPDRAAPVGARIVGGLRAAGLEPRLASVRGRSLDIDRRELALQREAYAGLLSDPGVVEALKGNKVAIVEFDTSPEIMVEWTDPQSAACAYRRPRSDPFRGLTGIGKARTRALALLAGKNGRRVIDISGDGPENVDPRLLSETRAAASAQAIEINGLAIVSEEAPEIDDYFRADVVNGFVLRLDRREDFLDALKRKLFHEIAGTRPEPMMTWRR